MLLAVNWDYLKKLACLTRRLNRVGHMYRLTLGGAITMGISLSLYKQRGILQEYF